jgi:HlyD family secretion protein
MKRRSLVAGIVTLAAIIAGAGLAWRYLLARPSSEQTAIVRRGTIEATVNALGRVQPKQQLSLSTRGSGTVKRILVERGQKVQAGELLLELDAQEYDDAVSQAERNLKVRRQQLEEALAAPDGPTLDLARAKLRRATALRLKAQQDYDKVSHRPDAESSDEALALEAAKLEYEIARAEFDRTMQGTPEPELERLRADIDDAEAALRQAMRQRESARIYAPFAGTIMGVEPKVGENVYGFSPLVRLADLSQFQIVAEIDEIDVPRVAEGQNVRIRLDAFPARDLDGKIARLFPGVSETRGTTTYEAIVDLEGEALPLRPGMGASLNITTQVAADVLLVPRRAIRQVGRYQVANVLMAGRTKQVVVVTGLSNEAEIEVLSGLSEGQIVTTD